MVRFLIVAACATVLLSSVAQAQAKKDPKDFARTICSAVEKNADAIGLDKKFFIRLLWKESMFDPNAVSPVGAQGIAQFMPETAKRRGLADPFEPTSAVAASAKFLRDLKNQFGNLGLAAAAYNAGEQRVIDWRAGKGGMPRETQDYVNFITGRPVTDWQASDASFDMPEVGKSGSFLDNCFALARRNVAVNGKRVKVYISGSGVGSRVKRQPWGALLTADFNEARAIAMYRRLKLRFPGALTKQEPMVVRMKNLSRGTKLMSFVMLGAKTQSEAQAKCGTLSSAGIPCLVRKN